MVACKGKRLSIVIARKGNESMVTRRQKTKKSAKKARTRVSARQRADNHRVGRERSTIMIPNDLQLLQIKQASSTRWDIIPYTATEANPLAYKYGMVDELYFERTFYTHRNIGPDDMSYSCPFQNTKHLPPKQRKRCPICEYRSKVSKDPDADPDLLKSLLTQERQLWLIYDRDEDSPRLQLFDVSYYGFGKQLDAAVRASDEEDGYEFFADPEDGFTLKVSFEEKPTGGSGKWYPAERIDFKNRSSEIPEELLDHGFVLDDMITLLDYKDLEALFFQSEGAKDEEKEEEEEEEAPPKRRRRKPAKVEEEEDDDEDEDEVDEEEPDEDDDDEEEEEEEPPPKKRRRRKPAPVEEEEDEDEEEEEEEDLDDAFDEFFGDEDDDDEEEDDEEEEPAPKKRRRRK